MANIQTIAGVFRKLGAQEARGFIDGIITLPGNWHATGRPSEIEKYLRTTTFGVGFESAFDIVIREFNVQYE